MSAENESEDDSTKFQGTRRINGPVCTSHTISETAFIRKDICPGHASSALDGTGKAGKAGHDEEWAPYEKKPVSHKKL